jgi:hypothetical protein
VVWAARNAGSAVRVQGRIMEPNMVRARDIARVDMRSVNEPKQLTGGLSCKSRALVSNDLAWRRRRAGAEFSRVTSRILVPPSEKSVGGGVGDSEVLHALEDT